jgi:hypothetical protein
METRLQTLVGLQRAEFERANLFQGRVLVAQVLLTVPACATVVTTNLWVGYTASVLTLAAACCWAWLFKQQKDSRSHGEEVRRTTLLMHGLEMEIADVDYTRLRERSTVSEAAAKALEDPNWWSESDQPGYPQLAEAILQNAFFTLSLYRGSARQARAVLAILIAALCVAFFVILTLRNVPFPLTLARLICAFLALLVSNDFLGGALSYSRAIHAIEHVTDSMKAVKARGYVPAEVVLVLGEYNSVVESTPMPLPGIYGRSRETVENRWKTRHPDPKS